MEDNRQAEERLAQSKNVNPYEEANILSKIFFCWFFPIFIKGYKTDLTEEHLIATAKAHDSVILGDKLEKAWLEELNFKANPSLWRALWKVFWKELCLLGLLSLFVEVARLTQPLNLSNFLHYYEPESTFTLAEAYQNAGFLILSTVVTVLSFNFQLLCLLHLGMKFRVATCALIYRKSLKLSKSALAETTIGQMVNLLANDVARFNTAMIYLHNLWLSPLETFVVMYMLYRFHGFSAMIGVILLLLFVPLQMWMGQRISVHRLKTAISTDERIRLMNEIIVGIQVIKMYTWEKPFTKLVELTRRKEVQQILNLSVVKAILASLNMFLNRVALYLCILTFVLTGNVPNPQYVFTLTCFYDILKTAVTTNFPQCITGVAEAAISIKRLDNFMKSDELLEKREFKENFYKVKKVPQDNIKEGSILLKDASVKWIKGSIDVCLRSINFDAKKSELTAVVGPVGCGKTSLLHVVLKELPAFEGSVEVQGKLAYASQEPWLFDGSIRQNIVFGQALDLKKYEEVLTVCALVRDLTLFPYGDKTIVGERGVTLSGGQRARINLARAVYADADIYLLDDPLSAVDANVGKHIFDKCICGYLKSKCVVLVTHQLQFLQKADQVFLMDRGQIKARGTMEELKKSGQKYMELLKNDLDEKDEDHVKEQDEKKNELIVQTKNDDPKQHKEHRETGTIPLEVYGIYGRVGSNWFTIVILCIFFVFTQVLASLCDYFLSIWVNVEQNSPVNEYSTDLKQNSTKSVQFEHFPDQEFIWHSIFTKQNCIIIYSCLVSFTVIFSLARSILFCKFCIEASLKLHKLMLGKIVYAKMIFFIRNSSGRILNRFSRDIGAVDETLPTTLFDTIQAAISVCGITILIGVVNVWMFIPSFIMLTIFYFLRKGFLTSSRDLKRLEGTTRSPAMSHLTASLNGLTTIRAFGAQNILRKEFDYYQNANSSAYFMFIGANRTFGFWLDMHCVVFISLVILSFLFSSGDIFGGNVGLAITQSLTLTGMFQWGMRQWSELENQMTSVERVKEYIDVDPEKDSELLEYPENWPNEGRIEFSNLSLKYSLDDANVLKQLSFSLDSKEKVGVVGRTGAGKTSLINAMFRLGEIDGKILIDGIDSKHIPLARLRSSISIIPQEPVLFSRSLRKNLDFFGQYDDEVLWKTLEDVELKNTISKLPDGLETPMSEGGSNFSVGQRQLFCLARAILGNNKILILDEATANVDPQTDALIQNTIRRKFSNCTVITIAHRLHTIMDSDKVLVMDAGRVVEFGQPHVLLQDKTGTFSQLVRQTGSSMAETLSEIAKKKFAESQAVT